MALITTTNKDVLTRRIVTYASVGLMIFLGYVGVRAIERGTKHKILSENSRKVEEAINKKDFRLAESYITGLKEGMDIKKSDYIKLKFIIDKNRNAEGIDNYVMSGDIGSARRILNPRLWSVKERESIEKKIMDGTEENMFKNITLSNRKDILGAAQKYILTYPKGEHTNKVIRYAIEKELSIMEENSTFSNIESHIIALNDFLYTNKDRKIVIKYNLRKMHLEYGLSYGFSKDVDYTNIIQKGMIVAVKPFSDSSPQSQEIVARDNTIKPGSIGEVVDVKKPIIKVKFGDTNSCRWSREWKNIKEYECQEKTVIMGYTEKELAIGTYNPESSASREDIYRTYEILSKYYTKNQ